MENHEEKQDKSGLSGFLPVILVFGGLIVLTILVKVLMNLFQ